MEAATLTHAGPAAPARLLRAASDERLVAQLRAGDERCFEVIYDRYHLPLLAFCRHMVGTREEAEDALQQVFVSAHGQLCADMRAVNLRPWLYAIARNRCLSMLRARRETVALDDLPEPSADGLAVAAQFQQRQDLQDILKDLAQLPADQRAALVLAELDDLSHDDIAHALDVRRDKVKALIFQARESLMGFRQARDADCGPIREQLSTLRGGALRRTLLQRHVAVCPGCAAFKAEVKRQRTALGAVMPVVPALALKDQVLSAVHAASSSAGAVAASGAAVTAGSTFAGAGVGAGAAGVGGAAATSGLAGTLAAAGTSGLVVKGLAVAAVAVSAGGGAVAVQRSGEDAPPRSTPIVRSAPASPVQTRKPFGVTPPAAAGTTPGEGAKGKGQGAERAGGRPSGLAPVTGQAGANGNGSGGKAFENRAPFSGRRPGAGADGSRGGGRKTPAGQPSSRTDRRPATTPTARKPVTRPSTRTRPRLGPVKPLARKPVRTTSSPPTSTSTTPPVPLPLPLDGG